ncbi:hypothetical protein OIO90_006397 [Microbotryomycetes sp. JL221]|nr:hypothetical protein OIO90_006397 [Microbotryomycetes sp. JL221]
MNSTGRVVVAASSSLTTSHARQLSLIIHTNNRSYQQHQDDVVLLPQKPQTRRQSYSQEPIRHQWSRQASTSTYVPVGFPGAPAVATEDQDDETYYQHNLNGSSTTTEKAHPVNYFDFSKRDRNQSRFDMNRLRKMTRGRRGWARITIVSLCGIIVILLLAGGKSTDPNSFVEKTKMRAMARRKNPLKSSIPLHSFRSNLKPGSGYVTSFPYGGLTNQLIELFKLVHLGQRLDRTAILPELKAVHAEGGDVPVSTFFDLQRFNHYSNVSMVEWKDVKIGDMAGTQKETLSCWGWRDQSPLERYNIKTWYWPPPGQLTVPSSIETSMTFPAIEVLSSKDNSDWLQETAKRYFGSMENAPDVPDKQLLCFENLFYVPSVKFVEGSVDQTYTIEEMSPQDPVWSKVGVHLRFNSHVNHIADELMYALLGPRQSKQPFIAVHIRQGDFVDLGRIGTNVVEEFKQGVNTMQLRIKERKRLDKSWKNKLKSTGGKGSNVPVLFATDSDDAQFIKKLTKLGWIYINHTEFATRARFGGWYEGILDSVILSRATGLVGTKMSTFSYVAARRVEAWNGGLSLIVG